MTLRVSLACFAALVLVLAPFGTSSAWAHSTLVSSTPAIDAVVEEAPDAVVLEFSDPLTVPDGVVSIRDLAGRERVAPGVRVEDSTVTIPLDDADAEGTRVVAWNGISDHGTEISGSFVYHVGRPTPEAAAPPADGVDDAGVERELTELARAVARAGVVLLVGAGALLLLRRRRRRSAAALTAALAGIGVVVVAAVVAGFVTAPNADWLVAGAAAPVPTRLEQPVELGDGARATVTLESIIAGRTDVSVDVRTPAGAPDTAAQSAHLRYRPADKGMGFFRTQLEREGSGRFSAAGITIPFAGEWEFEVTVAADEFSAALATFTTPIRPNPKLVP